MWNLKKNDTNELIYKTEIDSPDIENKLMVTKGERRWRGISSEFGISRHTLLYIKWFPDNSVGKESTHNAGDPGSIPGSGRSSGEGAVYPL